MDEIRFKRYRDKINYIIENIKDLPFKPKNVFEKRGIFYSIQTSVESTIDIIAMLVKDLGLEVKDDATNISEIVKTKNLDFELGEKLKKINGLRNILVHRYNDIDENIVLSSINEVKDLLYDWLEIIEVSLNEFTNNR